MLNICDRIKEKRDCGRVTCAIFHREQVLPRNERLNFLGLRNLPDHQWIEVSHDEAKDLLIEFLTHDLAYRYEIMPATDAAELIDAYLKNFENNTRMLTNTTMFNRDSDPAGSYQLTPLTDATFDAGILFEDGGVVGILWVEDED